MSHPFEHFYRVWEAQELIDYAFSKASSKTPSLPQKLSTLERTKRKEMKRIESTITILSDKLKSIIQSVPSLENLPEFYRRLSHLLVNNDELRINLGRLNGILPVLTRLRGEYRRRISQQESNQACADIRVEFFGRCASIITQQSSTFRFLEECRVKLQQIPIVNLQLPSVVIAGYPNVGKSTLVGKLSSAQPQIAEYPFTTKQIYIGLHTDPYGSPFFQVIDTPGVLDRPMEHRNVIERQAILALNTIASVILFIIDPTMTSGYELNHQVQLYHELMQSFIAGMNIPFKVVINKIDLATPEELNTVLDTLQLSKSDVFLIDAKEGQNVTAIQEFLMKYFKETNFRR